MSLFLNILYYSNLGLNTTSGGVCFLFSDLICLFVDSRSGREVPFVVLPLLHLFCCVLAAGPPDIPLLGPLKSPLCLIWARCQRIVSAFSPLLPSAPAAFASLDLMQMRACLIKGLITLLFEYDAAYQWLLPKVAWMAHFVSCPEVNYGSTQPLNFKWEFLLWRALCAD